MRCLLRSGASLSGRNSGRLILRNIFKASSFEFCVFNFWILGKPLFRGFGTSAARFAGLKGRNGGNSKAEGSEIGTARKGLKPGLMNLPCDGRFHKILKYVNYELALNF